MHKRYCLLILLLFLSLCGYASIPPVDTIALWKGENIRFGKEVSLYAYKPEQPNGISIIVCPGGSYYWHDKENEGELVAEWLRSKGITAFVLTYRVAGAAEIAFHTRLIFRGKRHPDMITDAQRALQYVQEHAPEYQLDSTRIGMMGFSAGGHLVMSAACFSSTNFLQLSGIETNVNLRPAFVAAVYPVVSMHPPYVHKRSRRGLLGDSWVGRKSMRDSLSLEKHIPDNCPPVFLINCVDDPIVPYQNSVLLDSALSQKGVPHEYLQYQEGKHGFGASDYYGSQECREWRNEFLRWLETIYPCSL